MKKYLPLLLFFVLPCGCLTSRTVNKIVPQPVGVVDDYIFREMFRGQADYNFGHPWIITAVFPGFPPTMPEGSERTYLERARDLAITFNNVVGIALNVKFPPDEETQRAYEVVVRKLIAKLGTRPENQYLVRTQAYKELQRAHVLEKVISIANANGSKVADVIPEGWKSDNNDWDKNRPGVIAFYLRPKPQFRCTEIFWFCPTAGSVDPLNHKKGGQLTLNTWGIPELESCLARLQSLRNNRDFSEKYDVVMAALQREASAIDPADSEAMTRFLSHVYEELEGKGIPQQLQ